MKSRGCRKLKRGNAGVPTNVYKISVARFTCCVVPPAVIAVVPLLYCTTNAFKVQRKCGLELFLVDMCSGWNALKYTQKHRS